MQRGEEPKVASLVWEVFAEFEAPGYKQEGINEFKKFIQPDKITEYCEQGNFFVICCKNADETIGVIAVREDSHISLLFVKKEYHQRGIARKLFMMAIEKCCNKHPGLQTITVNSSPYAVKIYEKMGFKKVGAEQEQNGIRFIPMLFVIDKCRDSRGHSFFCQSL